MHALTLCRPSQATTASVALSSRIRWCVRAQVGIVGLPNVGKSTLFNTLTKMGIPAENFPFCTIDPNNVRLIRSLLTASCSDCLFASIDMRCGVAPSHPRTAPCAIQARVNVPDDRFKWLCEAYKPKSEVPAFLEIVDIAGLVKCVRHLLPCAAAGVPRPS